MSVRGSSRFSCALLNLSSRGALRQMIWSIPESEGEFDSWSGAGETNSCMPFLIISASKLILSAAGMNPVRASSSNLAWYIVSGNPTSTHPRVYEWFLELINF